MGTDLVRGLWLCKSAVWCGENMLRVCGSVCRSAGRWSMMRQTQMQTMQRLLATRTTSGRIRTAGDAYRVLSVRMNAPFEEVKGAYFELAKKHHPDVVAAQGGDPDEAHAYFLQLGESYALLKELKEREAAGASSSRAGSSSAAASHAWWDVWLRPGSGPGALLGDDSVDTTNFLYPDRPTSEKIVTAALEAGDVDAADRILRCLPEVGASPLD